MSEFYTNVSMTDFNQILLYKCGMYGETPIQHLRVEHPADSIIFQAYQHKMGSMITIEGMNRCYGLLDTGEIIYDFYTVKAKVNYTDDM